jgi:hypothetical protein
MKKPDINAILEDIKSKIEPIAIGWDVVLMPENFKSYLPNSDKGSVFVGFRGINLGGSSSEYAVVQFGEMAVQISIMATSVYGDDGSFDLTMAIAESLTGSIMGESPTNARAKSYINAIGQVDYIEDRGMWVYGLDFRLPVFLSE